MDHSQNVTAVYNILIFTIFVFGMVLLSFFINSFRGSWDKLAQYYRFQGKYKGKKYYMKSLGTGGFIHYRQYSFCITIGVNNEGLYLSFFPLFRFAHYPLFIPWNEIERVEEANLLFSFRTYKLRFKQTPEITVSIEKGLGDMLFNDYWYKIPATSTLNAH
ncbi:MAG: hypothetical protein ACE14V_08370 [bacterium]